MLSFFIIDIIRRLKIDKLDFQTKKVVEVYSSRHKYFLSNRLTLIPKAERDNVKAIIIDMWDTYNELAHIYFKNAIVAVDSFHVIKQLNDNCDDELESLINEFNNSTLDEFRDFGRLIRNWKKEIKNSFIRSNGRRLSNGAMEGVNSIIKQ